MGGVRQPVVLENASRSHWAREKQQVREGCEGMSSRDWPNSVGTVQRA